MSLTWKRVTDWHIAAEGYAIAKFVVGLGGVYVATTAGSERIAAERFTTPDQQKAALQACKDACETHAQPLNETEAK